MNPTPEPTEAAADDDPRLVRAAQEYLAALESGRRPDRAAFVARFPEIAGGLPPYLDALDLVHGADSPFPALSAGRAPAPAASPAPEALGDFHIVREIGRGGMGVVYEAIQLSLGRRVALKVLPFAAALDARQLQRFKNEAQAAAQLHHTNIVPVYAVGCERGTHYYAMQLIEGRDLGDLIQELRGARQGNHPHSARGDLTRSYEGTNGPAPSGAAPRPTAAVTLAGPSTQPASRTGRFYQTAARLAGQAADALDHAHQMGVVHRDVKPANLIVDGHGNVWVTDFGLAQFNADAGLTQSGALLGTLRYMSPEQAGGRGVLLDHRTDVYSLGATLYELLTLRPIFDGDDRQTLLARIAADEPRRPRAIDRAIPAELETIVLKAVAKNPGDRYATAKEFADDLRRFLDHRPILARPPSPGQRARKWARRNPTLVGAAAVLCVLTTIGSLVAAGMLHHEQQQTYQEQQKAVRRAEQAEAALTLARQSADEMIQISEQELAGKPFTEDARKRMLTSALVYYRGLMAQRRDDPDAQADLAVTQTHVNQILADLAVLQGVGRADLLNRDDVTDDLALTPEQRKRWEVLRRDWDDQGRKDFEASHGLSADERERQALEDARVKEAAVEALLTPGQRERLSQIALQLRGLFAFHDPEIAERLNLTAAQKNDLRSAEAAMFLCGPPARRGNPGAERRASVAEFVEGLTAGQRRAWAAMTGEPFKETARPFGPDGPPGHDHHGPPGLWPGGPPGPPPLDRDGPH